MSKTLRGALLGGLFWAGIAQAVAPIKGETDHRDYRYLTLENGMEVLLISDPRAEKAAAALDVGVGHYDNPPDRPGLAHFLEHMLFLGTKTYPEADEYHRFISVHGGRHNAYTAAEHTNYYFDINPDHLNGALDRFSRFFSEPLFNPEYVERERHAVESEFRAKLKNDARRIQDVHQTLMNENYPGARFSVGNLETLENTEERPLRKDLLAFYRQHYSADVMRLVILGRQPLDYLQKLAVAHFSPVPKRERGSKTAYPPMFAQGALPLRVEIEPEKEIRRLSLLFPMPAGEDVLTHKPLHYLGHLLGHEGEGSLLSLLKELGWAEGLSAGVRQRDRQHLLFQVSVDLTELGVRAADQIVALVFHAIDELGRHGLDQWRYDELKRMGNINFRFQEVRSPIDTVRSLAHRMHHYAPKNVLRGDDWFAGYSAEVIKRYLAHLSSDNVLVSLVAPGVEGEQRSPYYQAAFRRLEQPVEQPEIKERVQKRLALPEPNEFIPDRLTVKEAPLLPGPGARTEGAPDRPQTVVDQARMRAWYQWDDEFEVPKTSIRLRLKLPAVASGADGAAQAELFTELVRDQLNEFAYPAHLAGLEFSLQPNTRGLDVEIFGYSGRQNLLLTRIVSALREGRFKKDRFVDIKNRLERRWRNETLDTPYAVIARQVPRLHFAPYWLGRDKLGAIEGVDLKSLHRFADSLLDNAELEVLMYGNLYRQEAVRLAAYLEHQLLRETSRRKLPAAQVFRLNGEGPWVHTRPLEHKDNVAMLYVQGLATDLDDQAHMHLVRRLLKPAFFNELRTEQQLGYIATVFPLTLKDQPGTALVVQSPSAGSDQIRRAMEGFLAEAGASLADGLDAQKAALVRTLREPAKTLYQQSGYYWESLVLDDLDFNRRAELAAAVERVSEDSLTAYYQSVFANAARRLWLVTEQTADSPKAQPVVDIAAYQKALEVLEYR